MRVHIFWLLAVVVLVSLLARWKIPVRELPAANDAQGVHEAVTSYLLQPADGAPWRVGITHTSFDDADHATVAAVVIHGARKSAPLTLDLARRAGSWKVTSVKGIPQTPL